MNFQRYSGIASTMFGLECWMANDGATEYSIWKIPVDDLGPETYRVNKTPLSADAPLEDRLHMVGDAFSFPSAVELAERDAMGVQREGAVHE